MKRNEFFKTCVAGFCGCGMLGMMNQTGLAAEQTAGQAAPAESEQLKRQIDGAQERFAKLVTIMGAQLDPAARMKILTEMGHRCAQEYSKFFTKYSGNLPGFLAVIKTAWAEKADYDEKTGIVLVAGKPAPCACPLVKAGSTPGEFCDCTRGWQEEAFSIVTGKPVTVEIVETVLRGGTRCTFRIGVKKA